jgi:hypothetical protein
MGLMSDAVMNFLNAMGEMATYRLVNAVLASTIFLLACYRAFFMGGLNRYWSTYNPDQQLIWFASQGLMMALIFGNIEAMATHAESGARVVVLTFALVFWLLAVWSSWKTNSIFGNPNKEHDD